MLKYWNLIFFFGACNVFSQTYSNHRAVQAEASWKISGSSLKLDWIRENNTDGYKVYRRLYGDTLWGEAIAILGKSDSTYTDDQVNRMETYEYAIEKTTALTDPFNRPNKLKGYGYILTSYKKSIVHNRGTMGVFVMDYIQSNLPEEVDILLQDLIADGWNIFKEVISSNEKVEDVNIKIKNRYKTEKFNALYLLGHIPVPYSGLYCQDVDYPGPPDGHGRTDANSHCGAWPADVYYGVIDGIWTDLDSITVGKREENKNRIGDGKFDNTRIPGKVEIGIGRVDFSNLPALDKSEIELTRQYLNKVHKYKSGKTPLIYKGIVEDNFSILAEGFGAGAVRDFAANCGKYNVLFGDVLTKTVDSNYALSYTCGAGWYYFCNGFGATINFNTKKAAAFNHLYGSYFGDFDSENNLLRGTLGSADLGFVSIWSGRPKWLTHSLALGDTYGEVTRKSQNNWKLYDAGFYQNTTNMVLIGDPSLRHHMIIPPTQLILTTKNNDKQVDIIWNKSSDSNVIGYYIYRKNKSNNGFNNPINEELIEGNSFTDTKPLEGINYYLIKSVKITTTASGSYVNTSIGVMDSILINRENQFIFYRDKPSQFNVYPSPVDDFLFIERNINSSNIYLIFNNQGVEIMRGSLKKGVKTVNVQKLVPGGYYIQIGGECKKFIKH